VHTRTLIVLALVASTLSSACEGGATPAASEGADDTNAVVDRVVDGDTLVVTIAGDEERLRLIGVDTPETVKPDAPVECFGPEASQFTKDLLPTGTWVLVQRDVEARDDFDRLLGYVFLADGTFVNLELLRQGFATPLTIEPNTAYADAFADAARSAEDRGLGLWAACPG
jgi:micrococcal nuclease